MFCHYPILSQGIKLVRIFKDLSASYYNMPMEWLTTIKDALQYIEDHLLEVEGADELASHLAISSSYLQQGFQIMTEHTISEYIRNRRLYQAARDLMTSDTKITDIALKYGYDNSASFSKAFTRFHEASPSEVRKGTKRPRAFFPIQIAITIRGGQSLDVEIVEKEAFRAVGFMGEYTPENSTDIAKRWKDINRLRDELKLRQPETPLEMALLAHNIGSCGVTEYPANKGPYRYLFGGIYRGGEVPSEMQVYEIRKGTWAVFNCVGKLPDAMEEINDLIWNHWVPDNAEYVVDGQCEFELYYQGDYYNDPEYLCTKWIPVKKRV